MTHHLDPLEGSRPLFEALTHSPDPVFVTDRHGRIVFWNASARQLLGHTADEAVGKSCCELLAGCDAFGNHYCSPSCPILRMATRGEVVHQFELRLRAKDERIVRVGLAVLQLKGSSPDAFFLAHILRPIEEPRWHFARDAEPEESPPPAIAAARDSADARVRKLTGREVEILGMLAAGRTTPEIAERLHISRVTARNHIQNILNKLEIHSKAEAVAIAFQRKLL